MWPQVRGIGLIASCVLLMFAGSVPAQQPVPKQALDLQRIIRDWQVAQSQIDRLDARFTYTQHDEVFNVTISGQGLTSVDRAGRAFYQLKPKPLGEGGPRSIERGGRRHHIKPAANEEWHWTDTHIIKVDHANREYENVVLPEEDRHQPDSRPRRLRPAPPPLPEEVPPERATAPSEINLLAATSPEPPPLPVDVKSPVPIREPQDTWWTSWFRFFAFRHPIFQPFLLNLVPETLQRRFQIQMTKQTDTEVWLEFTPRSQPDLSVFSKAYLILNVPTYRPKALKIVDYSLNRASVWVFSDVRINQPPAAPFGDLGAGPDLKRYKRLSPPK